MGEVNTAMPSCEAGCERYDGSGHLLIHWIASAFGQCVYSGESLGISAFWIGMSSLGFW